MFPLEAARDEQSHAETFAAGVVVGVRVVEIRSVFLAVVDQIRAAERTARVGHLLFADDEPDPAVDNRFQIFRNKSVRTEAASVDPEFKFVFSGFLRRIIDKNGTAFDAERNFVSVAENFRRFRFCAAFRRDAEPFIRKDGFLFKRKICGVRTLQQFMLERARRKRGELPLQNLCFAGEKMRRRGMQNEISAVVADLLRNTADAVRVKRPLRQNECEFGVEFTHFERVNI